jgi:3-hydroxymyristoyl/3-hydroxydecanoyl-(acyl carrier protein) dehydratase
VLQIEAMAQLGGLVMLDPANQEAKEQFFFGGIEGCRFRRPVVPGDTLVRCCACPGSYAEQLFICCASGWLRVLDAQASTTVW